MLTTIDANSVHNDIKPDNILVGAKTNPATYDIAFKLADLGLTEFEPMSNLDEGPTVRENRGTQMFSKSGPRVFASTLTQHNPGAPECFIDEADLFLLRTSMEAKPSKDIWALGCVFSTVAVWSVFGYGGVLEYEQKRATATQRIPELHNTAYSGCFHDTVAVLDVVHQTHRLACAQRQSDDHLIEHVVALTSDMLNHALKRPSAIDVYKRSRKILTSVSTSSSRLHCGITSSPRIERRTPPQIPQELCSINLDENTHSIGLCADHFTAGQPATANVEMITERLNICDSVGHTPDLLATPSVNVTGNMEYSRRSAESNENVREDLRLVHQNL
jgi:serine/threonine protein kinase